MQSDPKGESILSGLQTSWDPFQLELFNDFMILWVYMDEHFSYTEL